MSITVFCNIFREGIILKEVFDCLQWEFPEDPFPPNLDSTVVVGPMHKLKPVCSSTSSAQQAKILSRDAGRLSVSLRPQLST